MPTNSKPALAQQAQPLTDEITFVGDALAADANRGDRPEWCYENAGVAVAALNEYRGRMVQQAQPEMPTRDAIETAILGTDGSVQGIIDAMLALFAPKESR